MSCTVSIQLLAILMSTIIIVVCISNVLLAIKHYKTHKNDLSFKYSMILTIAICLWAIINITIFLHKFFMMKGF